MRNRGVRIMPGLRFCMVTTFYPPYNFGGDGIGVQRLSQALVRRGHQVTVLQDVDTFRVLSPVPAPSSPDPGDGVEVCRFRSAAPAIAVLLTHQTGRPVLQGRKIRQILQRRRFDVINFHNISLTGGPGILAAGDALKLYMAHAHWLVCPSHVLWRHDREPCTGRQCLRCVLRFRRPPQLWRYTGYLDRQLRHVDAFIAMSNFSREKHREFGFPREMEVVNYFLPDDAKGSGPEHPGFEHPRPFFLFVGRLERIKGLDTVIPVFHDYEQADLLIAGDGEERQRLEALAAGNDRVRFLGRVDSEQLAGLYRRCQALIVPSVGFETFGIILIEAFKQGTPVIARRIGPFPEIVGRCGGGVLFDEEDELPGIMSRIQNDPARREELARAARAGFERYWSEDVVVGDYLRVVGKAAVAKGRHQIVEALAQRRPS